MPIYFVASWDCKDSENLAYQEEGEAGHKNAIIMPVFNNKTTN